MPLNFGVICYPTVITGTFSHVALGNSPVKCSSLQPSGTWESSGALDNNADSWAPPPELLIH